MESSQSNLENGSLFHGFYTAFSHRIDQWLGFCKEKNTGSHDDVTRDSGRNGR
jgi:hypothetical protein